ncbi:MAG: transposase [Nitrospiria bacterium]
MGLCLEGLDAKITSTTIQIQVAQAHPYIQLANMLDWSKIAEQVKGDLKSSTLKRLWWVGRKLQLRIHLGIFILQSLIKMSDRGIEEAIRGNGIYQAFCGKSTISQWHCPDHTSIEKFRNRISPSTQQDIVSHVVKKAHALGFADPSKMDVDSTVQEAAMAYPSDAHLLTKLAGKCKKVVAHINKAAGRALDVDIQSVKKKAKAYFFLSRNKSKEIKRQTFEDLYNTVRQAIEPTVAQCMHLTPGQILSLPWNIQRAVQQIRDHARKYLRDVAHFIKTHTMMAGKILSFHYLQVACISKGKVGREVEFGRVFQLGRIGGNFLMVLPSTSVRQEDKAALLPMVQHHQNIFGNGVLESLATDKGYYTRQNVESLRTTVKELGIQIPGNVKKRSEISKEIMGRRAGIEPLIGHAKKFGLAKSTAKSDQTTLASGYRAVLGYNLHQLTRHLSGKANLKTREREKRE